jgi:proteasome lid subunit RPN8/RPN11
MSETRLKLQEAQLNAIKSHIASRPGQEVCGLVGGLWQPFDRLAVARTVVPIENVDPSPTLRFTMSPREQVAAMLDFEKCGWEVVGIYHSHPGGPARPSPTDLAEASFPDAVYLIGVPGGDLTAWWFRRRGVRAVQIEVDVQ